jgi:regulator of cell morphogenesis and NO signaling
MNSKNWSRESLIKLVEYIEQHHRQMEAKLLKLQTLLEETAEAHKDKHSGIESLQEFFPVFKTEMEDHFAREEHTLLPYIRQMDAFDKNSGPKPEFHRGSIKNPISQLEYDHDRTENIMFAKIRTETDNYHLPSGAGDAFKALYDGLKDIETNISEHIYLEHNVLFPLAINLELQLIHKK